MKLNEEYANINRTHMESVHKRSLLTPNSVHNEYMHHNQIEPNSTELKYVAY